MSYKMSLIIRKDKKWLKKLFGANTTVFAENMDSDWVVSVGWLFKIKFVFFLTLTVLREFNLSLYHVSVPLVSTDFAV